MAKLKIIKIEKYNISDVLIKKIHFLNEREKKRKKEKRKKNGGTQRLPSITFSNFFIFM